LGEDRAHELSRYKQTNYKSPVPVGGGLFALDIGRQLFGSKDPAWHGEGFMFDTKDNIEQRMDELSMGGHRAVIHGARRFSRN
jgi:hypothetical protein